MGTGRDRAGEFQQQNLVPGSGGSRGTDGCAGELPAGLGVGDAPNWVGAQPQGLLWGGQHLWVLLDNK